MNLFVVLLRYVRPLDEIDGLLDAHRAFLREQYRSGRLLASGPRRPRTGGVLLVRAHDAAAVVEMLERDPFGHERAAEYEVIAFDASMHDARIAWALEPDASPA